MKSCIQHGINSLLVYLLINTVVLIPCAYAAGTRIKAIREGMHAGFSRLVFDCEGHPPQAVGPSRRDSFSVRYTDLTLDIDLKKISAGLSGNVQRIDLQKENSTSEIKLLFAAPDAKVKFFILKSETAPLKEYRLVIDVYAQPAQGATGKEKTAAAAVAGAPAPQPGQASQAAARSSAVATAPAMPAGPDSTPSIADAKSGPPAAASAAAEKPAEAPTVDKGTRKEAADWIFFGEASLILRASDGEDESSKFEEYRDISQPIAGDFYVGAEKDRRLYLKGGATRVGQDDPAAAVEAGRYGKYGLDLQYDRLIRRYAFDVKTLYSGVGSGTMTLDDGLQTALQAVGSDPVAQAALLDAYMAYAATGDPDVTRDRLKLGFNIAALKPFNIKIELGHEMRQGTRPFAGAFNNEQMVELFEPIDYETTDMKIIGEYAQKGRFVNFEYHYSQFANNIDTLTFDNPLRATDALLGPSTGRIDLAPDNQYHNLAFTGALTRLPWNSQATANVAFGWMMQDDDLVPFTSNTAISAPAPPKDGVDAKVNTALYQLRLTSRPRPFMRVKADLRYYDYANKTDRIEFTNGYVETDEVPIATAITNLPSSYTKTRAGLDLGFDVMTRTSLGIGYAFEGTERENRQVDRQDDNIFKASLDTRALDWLDLRASFQRTDRRIGDYNYDVYLKSGDDLEELPQMRKYDQADKVRDQYRVQATVYPIQALAVTGAFTYGTDDFKDSPYGLLEDNHYIASLDADYAINERATVNLFYTYEKYENTQRGQQGGTDWTATGEDLVNSFGGGLTVALLPQRLDLDLTYSYSDVDGTLAFSSPSGSLADYEAVDDTKMHVLNSKLKYRFSKKLVLSVGYLWEKFDYEDYNINGFVYVPMDTDGNYQGALLAGTLPRDYDAQIVYTHLTLRY